MSRPFQGVPGVFGLFVRTAGYQSLMIIDAKQQHYTTIRVVLIGPVVFLI